MASQSTQSNSSSKKLTINDLPLLCNALNPVASKCFALGLQLGVQYPQIYNIQHNYRTCEDQLREIILERLKQDKRLTWHNIVTALRSPSVNHPDLVGHIESWYMSPSLDLQQDPAFYPQQHLSLSGERPYHMVMMGQTTVNTRENPNMGTTSVPTSSLWGASFSNQMEAPYWKRYQPPTQMMGQTPVTVAPHGENYQPPTQMIGQTPVRGAPYGENYQPPTQMMGQTSVMGAPHGENYQPYTQMMGQTPVRGPPHGENYQPPTQMMGQIPVRGAPHGENYQPPTQMMGQIPVRGPPHGEPHTQMMGQIPVRGPPHGEPHTQMMGQIPVRGPPHGEIYQPHTQMMGQIPVRGPPHGENYQLLALMTGWTQVRGASHGQNYQPFALMRDIRTPDSPYMYLPHHMTPYQTVHPNTLSTTQPYPTTHTQGSSATAYHRSPMDIFVHYVKNTYKQYEIEKNLNVLKWPPTPSKIFINLACIDWESVVSKEEADEYTRAMVEDGNVDVIMKEKTNIDFSDIVQDLPPVTASEKVVLVEGAPGVGKSTFAWEFCRRWERGEIAQQYQLVLLLRLRDERMSSAKSLRDLIYHSSESVCQSVVEELESTLGVNTLIILEGFDELPDSQRKDSSIFLELILGQLLLHATIMITSRPWATGALLAQFKHRIFLHVEILGFTEENITKYVTSVFTGEGKRTTSTIDQSVGGPDKVSEEAKKNIDDVMTYIGKYPQIKACMYIPLNAAIVVSIYRESMKSNQVLPKTLTELYQALTQILLLRHLCGHAEYSHQKWSVESFEHLPGEVYSQFLDISKIAYKGICREGDTSVQLIFPDIPDDFETLGLMQSVSQLFMYGQKTSHNFLHLTVQEFLAAFLISTMSSSEQMKDFQRHKDGRLRVVLRFVAGLTKLNKVTPDELRNLLEEPTVEQSDDPYCNPMRPDVCVSAHHTNWLFEAQNSELLQSLFHNHTASFTFTRGMLPLEYYSLGYCIAHSHSKWSLTFDEDAEKEKLHMLVSGAKTCDSDYRVALKATSMTPEKMNILVNGFSSHIGELYYLKIPDNGKSLSLLPISTLHILELQIDNNKSPFNISSDLSFSKLDAQVLSSTCMAIGMLLSSTTSLKKFCLSLNIKSHGYSAHISNDGMEVLTRGLSDNIALLLKSLDIDCKCTFTTTATRSLVQFITRSTTLQYIRICHVTFSAQGLIELTEAIHHCSRLQEKKLEKLLLCVECSEDIVNLRHMIKDHPDMENNIDWNKVTEIHKSIERINESNALTLSIALVYSYVKSLDLSNKGISNLEAEALTPGLYHCSTLESLSLNDNNINDAGTVALAQALHHNSTLKRLDLFNNNISNAGAVALAQALHHNSTLERLHLFCNNITDAGTVALAQSLHHNSTLERLHLSNNNISDAGTVSLAQALHHNSTLKRLDLSNNNINDAGAVALAQALHHNSTLKELYLSNNNISDALAVSLAQALHHNSILERLHLSGNDAIGKEGTHYLVQALTVNTSIYALTLSRRCEVYATQCTEYNTLQNRILFW